MSQKVYFTNEEMLQNAAVLFKTIETNNAISTKLDDYGYNTEELTKGKALYEKAQALYGTNKKETEEKKVAYLHFKQKMDELTKIYAEHRNKARLVFKNNPEAKISLGLNIKTATAILVLLEQITAFYTHLDEVESLRTPLARVKITQEDITNQLAKVVEVKNAYTTYAQEKNESEQSTKDKNKAFADLDHWMRELHAYAKYALSDQEQFLQIFGKAVE
ncbi:hypothetical protein [Riemerella columbina]|uniref:hypothetical protein n=1 Tax=Riemerella columbina TaxID=103810 RepID=UPI00267037C6|nr:hypothetical protein [Riemerella columbina]WKS94963.1 hypothetical protein NYR17_08540 [Riemerella columbina]